MIGVRNMLVAPAAFALITVGAGCGSLPTPEEVASLRKTDLEAARKAAAPSSEAAAQQAVVAYFEQTLLDPESARYRYWPLHNGVLEMGDEKYRGWFMCGELNAKNSFGGYVGYRPFLVYFDRSNPDQVRDGTVEQGEHDIVGKWCSELYDS